MSCPLKLTELLRLSLYKPSRCRPLNPPLQEKEIYIFRAIDKFIR